MLLSAAVECFLTWKRGADKASTVKWYTAMLKTLLDACPDALVEAVTPEMLDAWRAALAGRERYAGTPSRLKSNRGLSVYSLHGHIRAVRTFFKFCQRRGYIVVNPALDLRCPRLPAEPPKHITDDDVDRLLVAAGDNLRDYALVLVLASTGCRVGGLAGLERSAVDLKTGVIECFEKFDCVNAYYLSEQPLDVLRRWMAVCEGVAVFPNVRTGEALTENGIYQVLKRLAEKAGIAGRWNPHSFRHRKARELLENGASLEIVAEILHHKDISTTARNYGRWTKREVQEKHKRFSRKRFPDMSN